MAAYTDAQIVADADIKTGQLERLIYQDKWVKVRLTVRKHRLEGKNSISEADLEWIFARNYEGTE